MRCCAFYLIHLSIVQQLATLASLYNFHHGDYVYPKEKIDLSWEKVLLIQCECFQKLARYSKQLIYYSTVHDGKFF